MRSLKSSYGRLHTLLPLDNEWRRDLLELVVRMHNYKTRRTGINQTGNFYSDEKNAFPIDQFYR